MGVPGLALQRMQKMATMAQLRALQGSCKFLREGSWHRIRSINLHVPQVSGPTTLSLPYYILCCRVHAALLSVSSVGNSKTWICEVGDRMSWKDHVRLRTWKLRCTGSHTCEVWHLDKALESDPESSTEGIAAYTHLIVARSVQVPFATPLERPATKNGLYPSKQRSPCSSSRFHRASRPGKF
jgi:hypothetical protein